MEENKELFENSAPAEEENALALNEQQVEAMLSLSARIDIQNPAHMQRYGGLACEGLTQFAEEALDRVRGRDMVETGRKITETMSELKSLDTADKIKNGFFANLFASNAKKMEQLQARYDKTAKNVDAIAEGLSEHLSHMEQELAALEELCSKDAELYKLFTVYMGAGRRRLRRERETTLASMRVIARRTGLNRDAQNVKNFETACQQFEDKIVELEETRAFCLQMMPRFRQLQELNASFAESVRKVLHSSLPHWKEQTVQALGQTAEAETKPKADMEAFKEANRALRSALDELQHLRSVSSQKRGFIESDLQSLELRLRMKLLEKENA